MSKLTEHVYRSLRRHIISGNLSPGARLKEEHVAATLGVSRTPVRSALQRLIDDGLLTGQRGRGAVVAALTDHDIDEVFELRILLEGRAAGLAALNASPEQRAGLAEATAQMQRCAAEKPLDYLGALQVANNRFHRLILDACGSARLRAMATTLVDIPTVVGAFYVYDDADIQRSIQQHRDLLAAIERCDRQLAEEVMRVHLRIAYVLLMRSRSPQAAAGAEEGDRLAGGTA